MSTKLTNPAPQQHKLPMWRQLRSQLILHYITLAIGAVVVVTVSTLILVRSQSTQEAFRELETIIELEQEQIEQWLENTHVVFHLITNEFLTSPEVIAAVSVSQVTAETEARLNNALAARVGGQIEPDTDEQPMLEEVFIYNRDGEVISSSDSTRVHRVVTLQPFFEPSFEATYLQSPYYDISTGNLVMMMTQPILSASGETVGAIAGRLNIEVLRQVTAQREGLGDTGETYLVSVENNYLLTPSRFEGYSMNRAYRSEGINNALIGQNGSGVYANYQDSAVTVYGVYRWMPELNAALMAELSEAEAQTLFVQTSGLVSALGVGIAGIAAAIGFYAANSIARPITQLTRAATQIAAGDLSVRTNIPQENEIGLLADTFNQMTGQLEHTIGELDHKIDEIRHTNEELRVSTAKAREAARVKSEFLSTMSKELRTPLKPIVGFSEMLLMGMTGELTPAQTHKIQRLQENGKRLLNLINDSLDITRIEAGRIELSPKPFSPEKMVARLSAQMAPLAEQNKLTFESYIDPELPATVIGDERRIEQVVVNLLSNAFKFTEKGGVTLSVRCSDDLSTWSISVKDTGVGIPPHAHELIFEEFRQLDGSSTRIYKGSGLGLAITRQLTRVLGGQVSVESTLGEGSTFTVTLPLQTHEPAAEAVLQPQGA